MKALANINKLLEIFVVFNLALMSFLIFLNVILRYTLNSGLTFTDAETTFRHTYWAAATAIAYGTRAIMARMSEHGYQFRHIVLTGGHAKSPLLTALYADATGCDLILPDCDEPVLLGSAMTACAAAHGGDLPRALQQLAPSSRILPANPMRQALHQARYEHFSALYRNYQSRPRTVS